jgi:hypothetical protein
MRSTCLFSTPVILDRTRSPGGRPAGPAVTGYTNRQPSVAELACDFDGARTLVSAAPTLLSAPLSPVHSPTLQSDSRRWQSWPVASRGRRDFFSLLRQLANAGLPPGDKLKHIPRRSRKSYNSTAGGGSADPWRPRGIRQPNPLPNGRGSVPAQFQCAVRVTVATFLALVIRLTRR